MTFALGGGALVKRHGGSLGFAARFVPFPAVAAANVCNTVAVRWFEVEQGIEVTDSAGKVLGQSVTAAKQALYETSITRIILPFGNFIVTPILMIPLEKTILKKYPRGWIPAYGAMTLAVFFAWLPLSLALYPQQGVIPVGEVEPDIATKTIEGGVFYNKGL
jgi:hypothetical protein